MTAGDPASNVSRSALVRRHAVHVDRIDAGSPLQVGNGTFAFTVDATGLQTFPEAYPASPSGTLLGTHATWGWHSAPNPAGHTIADTLRRYRSAAGEVDYVDLSSDEHDGAGQTEAESWLRGNPHRLDLGRVGLEVPGRRFAPADLRDVRQRLDLWTGTVHSRFALAGTVFDVATAAHPHGGAVAVRLSASPPVRCGLRLRFSYGSTAWGDAADWSRPGAHRTDVARDGAVWRIGRRLDDTRYDVIVGGGPFELVAHGPHDLALVAADDVEGLDAVVEFADAGTTDPLASAGAVLTAAAEHWARFWETTGAIDLAASDDPRALELERRVVLSRYLTAVNSSGPQPPAESGLMLNTWRGRSHLEMHLFHAAHFALWGQPDVLGRQLDWYRRVLPLACETARRQRLAGARWPKQVDPSGHETPSSIGPFLVWQQPQPIYLAELLYRAEPTDASLERWADVVGPTADFMADFASPGEGGLGLGPPIVPAQESYFRTRRTARNPTFELAFWCWALEAAAAWWERSGRRPPARWRAVARAMARPHRVGATYAALATAPYLVRDDHPSTLAGFGLVPPTAVIDRDVMARTFDDVWSSWDWASTWGWDYPVAAMTATRLGRPDDAVAALFHDSPKNRFLPNGHNRQSAELPVYLPGNGALLTAVAMMAAGFDGAPRPSPGFGAGWRVAVDGVLPVP